LCREILKVPLRGTFKISLGFITAQSA